VEIAAVCLTLSDDADARLKKASATLPKFPAADLELLYQRLDKLIDVSVAGA
jgi:hypothetical protein